MRMKRADWDDVINTNLTAPFLLIQAVIGSMLKQRWGRIINVTSIFGQIGQVGQANYSSSKAGLIGLTMAVAGVPFLFLLELGTLLWNWRRMVATTSYGINFIPKSRCRRGDFRRTTPRGIHGKNSASNSKRDRQNRTGRVCAQTFSVPRGTDLNRGHGQAAARFRYRGQGHLGAHRFSGNARWPGQDASPQGAWRHPARPQE